MNSKKLKKTQKNSKKKKKMQNKNDIFRAAASRYLPFPLLIEFHGFHSQKNFSSWQLFANNFMLKSASLFWVHLLSEDRSIEVLSTLIRYWIHSSYLNPNIYTYIYIYIYIHIYIYIYILYIYRYMHVYISIYTYI